MSDDWLWDGTGEPDPETARLAALLGTARYRGTPPPVPKRTSFRTGSLAAAVGLALAAAVTGYFRAPAAGWDCGEDCRLAVGEWLETGTEPVDFSRWRTSGRWRSVRGRGSGSSRLSEDRHRVELSVGHVHASVTAPPRLLVVETPSAQAVDLGCAYDLTVLDDGSALLVVSSGEVSLEHPDRAARVPAGAAAMTWPGHGPGIPWVADADPAYVEALQAIDREGRWDRVAGVLSASRPADVLSLWHLVQRVPAAERLAVSTRIEGLVPGSVGATGTACCGWSRRRWRGSGRRSDPDDREGARRAPHPALSPRRGEGVATALSEPQADGCSAPSAVRCPLSPHRPRPSAVLLIVPLLPPLPAAGPMGHSAANVHHR